MKRVLISGSIIFFKIIFIFTWLPLVPMELQSQRVSEGKCFQPPVAPYINPFWFLWPRTYFIPLASEYSYLNYAEAFLSHSGADWSELEKMCLLVEIQGLTAVTRGYDRIIEQSCHLTLHTLSALSPAQLRCHVTRASTGTNSTVFDEYLDNVALTDNETYALYVRCVNGIRDYKVVSIHAVLPDPVKNEVIAKITELGFDPNLTRTLKCLNSSQHEQRKVLNTEL